MARTPITSPEPSTEGGAGNDAAGAAVGRRLTARGRDRRDALIDTATRLFAENGYHRTSVSDIVDRVGVGKGVFYWYFPSKDELFRQILRDALHDLRRTQRAALGDEPDPLVRLELGIRASLTWSSQHADVVRLVMFAWTDDSFAPALRKGRRIIVDDTAQHVSQAIDSGAIAEADPQLLATVIRGITDELSRQFADGTRQLDQELLDVAVRMCLHGVVGPTA